MRTAGLWARVLGGVVTNCWITLTAAALLLAPAVWLLRSALGWALAFVYFFSGGGPA